MSDKVDETSTDNPAAKSDLPTEIPLTRMVETEFYDQVPILTRYATNLMVQATPHECILSFYEAEPPAFLGKDAAEKIAALSKVKAHCVARVVIALARMPEFVTVIRNLIEPLVQQASAQEEKK